MGGISGRQGRFSGLVTEGMSSMGPIIGLAGLRWAWALAILPLVGLVGLALCRDATGKGPACPGLECCTEERGRNGWMKEKEDHRKERWNDFDRKEKWKRRNDGGQEQWGKSFTEFYRIFFVNTTWYMHLGNTCSTRHKWQSKKKGAKPLIAVRNETFGGSSQIL